MNDSKIVFACVFLVLLLTVLSITNVMTFYDLTDEKQKLKKNNMQLQENLEESNLELERIEEDHANLLSSHWDLSQSLVQYKQQIDDLEQENEKLRKELDKYVSLDVTATHYTAFCDTGCTGETATGIDVSDTIYHKGKRVIAVDPNIIPLGTELTVQTDYGSFEAIALDTGGAIKGHKIDILVSSKREARQLGKLNAKVVWKQ